MKNIDPLAPVESAPAAFAPIVAKLNEALAELRRWRELQAVSPLDFRHCPEGMRHAMQVDLSKLRKAIRDETEANPSAGGGGVTGFDEEAFTICENGSPVVVTLLVRR